MDALNLINILAPEHQRTSCDYTNNGLYLNREDKFS